MSGCVLPPTKTQAAVPDETLAHVDERKSALHGYARDPKVPARPCARPWQARSACRFRAHVVQPSPPRQTRWVMVDGEVLAWFGDGRKFILTAVVELAALFALARSEKDCWLTLRCSGRQ